MTLKNSRVVVLGGSSGIGLAVAEACLGEGAEVVIGSSSQTRVSEALERLGPSASGAVVDLGREEAIAGFFATAGAIDHLVFSAGEPLDLLTLDADVAAMRQFFEVRYWGAVLSARHARATIRPGGSIVLTSGTAAERPLGPGWAIASSICSAIQGLTRALAVELQPLRVNCVAPGVVQTPLWSAMNERDRAQMYAEQARRLPTGHVGQAAEVALSYTYFLKQTYVTGQVAYVDGGALLV